MLIKTFEGVDMNDALKKVKKELGGDAVILSSRKASDVSGGGREGVVVTAGLPQIDPPWAHHLPGAPEDSPDGLRLSEMDALREMIDRMEREWGPGASQTLRDLISRVGAVSDGGAAPLAPPFNPEEEAEKVLVDGGFSEQDRREILEGFRLLSYQPVEWTPSQVRSLLQFLVSQKIDVTGSLFAGEGRPGRPKVVLFVGPTGVGKTTTVAKIGAGLVARHKKRVGLLNLDTYRIGAVEQLRIYGDLMGVPVEVANTASRISGAIGRLSENDVILVDSAGRSEGGGEELLPFLSILSAGQEYDLSVVLVVSAGQKARDLEQTAAAYQKIRPEALVVTKIDETGALGSLYGLLAHGRLPVSYVTTGQKVPEDIEVAHGGRLAEWMIEGWSRDGSGVRA